MLSTDVRDAQVALELPAREMMDALLANFGIVGVSQNNVNFQIGLVAANGGQSNVAVVTLTQGGTAANVAP